MQSSVAPLLTLKIASIVILALGVHAVSAGDPFYGSDVNLVAPAAIPVIQ